MTTPWIHLLRRLGLSAALLTTALHGTALAAPLKSVYDPKQKAKLPRSFKIAGTSFLKKKEYRDLSGAAMAFMKRHPPERSLYVGMGRDPAPLIAFLQNLGGKEIAVNLPGTSGVAYKVPAPEVVARFVEAAIPAPVLDQVVRGERQMVLVDVTSSGKSHAMFAPLLDRYLKARGAAQPVVSVALSWVPRASLRVSDWMDVKRWKSIKDFQDPDGKYEGSWPYSKSGVAEHARQDMSITGTPEMDVNPSYVKFRDALREHMSRDEKLDRVVTKLNDPSFTPKKIALDELATPRATHALRENEFGASLGHGPIKLSRRLSGLSSEPRLGTTSAGDRVVVRNPRRGVEHGLRVNQALALLAEQLGVGEMVPTAHRRSIPDAVPANGLVPRMVMAHVGPGFVDGDRATKGSLRKISEASRVAGALLDGLIEHGDRRAGNIMVDREGAIRLIDADASFGEGKGGFRTAFVDEKDFAYTSSQAHFSDLPAPAQRLIRHLTAAKPKRLAKEYGLRPKEAEVLARNAALIEKLGLTAGLEKIAERAFDDDDGD